jgi:hypothetical protein
MPTIITNDNIKTLVKNFIVNNNKLPNDLQIISIGEWDVSRVTNMSQLFYCTDKKIEKI